MGCVGLECNEIGSYGASLISKCLASNPVLVRLHLDGNLLNDDDHFALHDSNHTCSFQVGEEDNCQLSVINLCRDPELNRKIKILQALKDIKYLDDVPMGIMPRVLDFLQGIGEVDGTKYNGVDQLFQVMRGWNMPLLYTLSSLDH